MRTLGNPGFELEGKHFAVWGHGRIGYHVDRLAKAFGCSVRWYDPDQKGSTALEELLPWAHIVSLHVTADESNRNLVNSSKFKLFRDGAFFLNSSRAWLVDFDELKDALENKLNAAWFDFELPFKHPQLVTTSHIGGSTFESLIKTEDILVKKLCALQS